MLQEIQGKFLFLKLNTFLQVNFRGYQLFPSTIIEWNNLNEDLRNSESFALFRSSILKFIMPSPNSFYGCQNIMGIELVTRLQQGLSHLQEHKFRHSFQDTLNPLCNCGMDVESSTHCLLQCPSYIQRKMHPHERLEQN